MRLLVVLALAAVLVLALVGALVSWRRRTTAQSGYRLPRPPAGAPEEELSVSGLHVATTFAGRPLDRVVVAGLGFRSPARIGVAADRVVLELASGAPIALPAARMTGAGTATWTLDRAVEPDGLTVLGWSLDGPDGPVGVESSFRLDPAASAALQRAVRGIVPPAPGDRPSD